MSSTLLWIVSALYLGTAVDLLMGGKAALALSFLAYSIANIGLIYASK